MSSVTNGLCVSVLDDAYHFSLTTNSSPPETIQASAPSASTTSPDSLDSTIRALSSKFANLNPTSQTFFCLPSTITTVQLRCIMNIIPKLGLPTLSPKPISYRQAYITSLSPADLPITIHFLQCSSERSEVEILEFESNPEDGRIMEIEDSWLSTTYSNTDDTTAKAAKVVQELVIPFEYPDGPTNQRIVILNVHSDMVDPLKVALASAKSAIPIDVVSAADLSAGAARYAPPDPNAYPRTKILAHYCMPLPLSIATTDGSAVVAVPGTRNLRPADESILLTTSQDNQTSAKLDIYLGNHPKAEDNLLSGTVVLDGLIPMPKGKTIIKATFVISHSTGATVTVEQVLNKADAELASAPKVVVLFPDLIKHLGSDYARYETAKGESSAPFVEDSETSVGDLPP